MQSSEQIRSLLQGTIDAIEDSIKIVSTQYEILFINRAAEKSVGKTCDTVTGQRCFDKLRGRIEPCPHCVLKQVIEDGHSQEFQFTVVDPDGRNHNFEQMVYPLRNDKEVMVGVVEVTRDVTERRAFERHLLHNEKLTALGKLAVSVAHEIRNPLTGVRLGIDSLLEETEVQLQKEALTAISEDIRRLDRTLNELLDLARRKEPKREETNLADLIDRAIFLVRKSASRQKIEIKMTLPPDLPKLNVDSDAVRQVLLNLFINSIQAMPEGGLLQIGGAKLAYQQRAGVLISVRDTGPGFPPEACGPTFDMFFTTKPSGTGVGLAISSRIISDHGGLLWGENLREGGALVNIFLPIETDEILHEVEHSAG
ncbi:MAG: ATP-binding protein [bacterium]|nr:ATP-binding protein [bacterium]